MKELDSTLRYLKSSICDGGSTISDSLGQFTTHLNNRAMKELTVLAS